MLAHGVAPLLISAAVGYWVFERATGQKKPAKTVGQVVGAIIIVVALLGTACKVYYTVACGKAAYGGFPCPMSGKAGYPFSGPMTPLPPQK